MSVVFQHGVEDLVGLLEKSRPLLVRAQNAVFDQNVQEQCSKRADEECDDGEQFLTSVLVVFLVVIVLNVDLVVDPAPVPKLGVSRHDLFDPIGPKVSRVF